MFFTFLFLYPYFIVYTALSENPKIMYCMVLSVVPNYQICIYFNTKLWMGSVYAHINSINNAVKFVQKKNVSLTEFYSDSA